ncbi:hypothetical protein ACFE04_031938 [Oxalis oulophora]
MEPATSATIAAGATITLTIHLMFTADNPNAVGIKYGESKFTVMYRGMSLGKAVVPGFYRSAHSNRGGSFYSNRRVRFKSNQTCLADRTWHTKRARKKREENQRV